MSQWVTGLPNVKNTKIHCGSFRPTDRRQCSISLCRDLGASLLITAGWPDNRAEGRAVPVIYATGTHFPYYFAFIMDFEVQSFLV